MDRAVIVFLKAPQDGYVKTRLAEFLENSFVLALYKGFVRDILDVLETAGDKVLYFWPPEKKQAVQKWLGPQYDYSIQEGDDLGQRMSNAFVELFGKGYTRVLLVGTDVPELSSTDITRAFQILKTKDAVIGPSSDGGYYLIGFQTAKFSKHFFDDIDWSTSQVLHQTLLAMDRVSVRYELLSRLNDIDTPEDLAALSQRVKKGGKVGRRTLALLKSYET